MTINLQQKDGGDQEYKLTLRREDFPQIPADATHLVREGWEDLDRAVDMLAEKASFGFAALLEAPFILLQATTEH